MGEKRNGRTDERQEGRKKKKKTLKKEELVKVCCMMMGQVWTSMHGDVPSTAAKLLGKKGTDCLI